MYHLVCFRVQRSSTIASQASNTESLQHGGVWCGVVWCVWYVSCVCGVVWWWLPWFQYSPLAFVIAIVSVSHVTTDLEYVQWCSYCI